MALVQQSSSILAFHPMYVATFRPPKQALLFNQSFIHSILLLPFLLSIPFYCWHVSNVWGYRKCSGNSKSLPHDMEATYLYAGESKSVNRETSRRAKRVFILSIHLLDSWIESYPYRNLIFDILCFGISFSYPLRPELAESLYYMRKAFPLDSEWLYYSSDIVNTIEKYCRVVRKSSLDQSLSFFQLILIFFSPFEYIELWICRNS